MSDHVVLDVDSVESPMAVLPVIQEEKVTSGVGGDSVSVAASSSFSEAACGRRVEDDGICDEEAPLIQMAECRICQDEDCIKNLESPCNCSGSLKYAHRKCVQHWCDEKGDTICEICHQAYQPDYTAPPPSPDSEDISIDLGGGWTISGTPLDLRDPRFLAMAGAERHHLGPEYEEYASSNSSGASFVRSAALSLLALLLLRHALTITDASDDDTSAFLSIFLLRVAGFLLPCYIMAWAISILQRQRQRQEEAASAETQVAFVLQSAQHRGLQFAIAPAPTVTSHQEPV